VGGSIVPDVLSVWTERDLVLFPYMIVARSDSRPSAVQAIERTRQSEHRLCFFVAQRRAADDQPEPDGLYRVGTICMLQAMKALPEGGIKVMVQGLRRGRAQRYWVEGGCTWAHVELFDDGPVADAARVGPLLQAVRANVDRAASMVKSIDGNLAAAVRDADDPGRAADLVASLLNIPVADAQPLLEIDDPVQRLTRANQLLEEKLQSRTDITARLEDLERLYERQFPGPAPEKVEAFLTAARMYRENSMPGQAIPLYEKVLAIQRAIETTPSSARVETLAHLATVLGVVGRYADGIAATIEAIDIVKAHHPREQAALYSLLNMLAGQSMGLKHYAEAERAWLDMLALAAGGLAARKESIAATHNNLGTLYLTLKDYDRAEKSLRLSVAMKQEVFGLTHPQVGLALYNLAQVHAGRGQAEEAARVEAEAVKLLGKHPFGN
jgi:tetratricopeptide (TPR) repeat protein